MRFSPNESFKLKNSSLLKTLATACVFSSAVFGTTGLHAVQANGVVLAEQKLLSSLKAIRTNQMDQALSTLSELSDTHPKYKLVKLLQADLLAVKAGQTGLINQVHTKNSKSVKSLLDEAAVRWDFAQVDLNKTSEFDEFVLKSANQKNIILVSLRESRLYLYQRNETGKMIQKADYYVTMGRKGSGKEREGDLRTPIGVYHMVDLLPGATLPDLYGVGALPLNYPNQWDRKNGKTGSGIWLHGVPSDTYIRAPKASRGCVVLNNSAMEHLLSDYDLPFSTPVVIVDENQSALKFVEDKTRLLSDVKAWLQDNNHNVEWEKVSVYRYPNENDVFYITFPGESDNTLVHQFWQRDADGDWKVVIESQDLIQDPSKKA